PDPARPRRVERQDDSQTDPATLTAQPARRPGPPAGPHRGASMTTQTLAELAALLDARLLGDGAVTITGVAGVREAGRGDVTFLVNPRYESYLAETGASAVLVAEPRDGCPVAQLVCIDPY